MPKRKRLFSATSLHNYFLRDPILDRFKQTIPPNATDLDKLLCQKGADFENDRLKTLSEQFLILDLKDMAFESAYKQTMKALKQGVPVISQAGVWSKGGLYGRPDLIIRKDCFEKFYGRKAESDYVVIEIKLSKLKFKVSSPYLCNQGPIKSYKAQTALYRQCLEEMLDRPIDAYIWGRNDLALVEEIDLEPALTWLAAASEFKITDIYPNMSNRRDHGYQPLKKEMSDRYKEITALWQCGVSHREKALAAGVTSWDDPRCTAELLGHRGSRAKLLNDLLSANRENKGLSIEGTLPDILFQKDHYYLDLEITNSVFAPVEGVFVYWIGIGYYVDNVWRYQPFVTKDFSNAEQTRIFKELEKVIPENATLIHWSPLEPRLLPPRSYRWLDLLDLFKQTPILVEGALNFSMKSIVKALVDLKLLDNPWPDSMCQNGSDSIVISSRYYQGETELYQTLYNYNEADCQAMAWIVKLLTRKLKK